MDIDDIHEVTFMTDFLEYLLEIDRVSEVLAVPDFDLPEGEVFICFDIIFDRETRIGFDVLLLFSEIVFFPVSLEFGDFLEFSEGFSISITRESELEVYRIREDRMSEEGG